MAVSQMICFAIKNSAPKARRELALTWAISRNYWWFKHKHNGGLEYRIIVPGSASSEFAIMFADCCRIVTE